MVGVLPWIQSRNSIVLDRLNPDEASLYQDLVEGRFGQRVRPEQERIRFGAVREAMSANTTTISTSSTI